MLHNHFLKYYFNVAIDFIFYVQMYIYIFPLEYILPTLFIWDEIISPLSISISSLGHCFLPCTFILSHFIEFKESFLSEEWLLCTMNTTFANGHLFSRVIKNRSPERVRVSLRFSLFGMKLQPTWSCEKKKGNICFVFRVACIVVSAVLGTRSCNDLWIDWSLTQEKYASRWPPPTPAPIPEQNEKR